MAQAYLALHATSRFLIVKKRFSNQWWNGAIAGAAIVNQAGQYAFPGGRMNPGETAIEAALREFYEESGFAISNAKTSDIGVVIQNANYSLVQCDISDQYLGQIEVAVRANIQPSGVNPARPSGAQVKDWEFGECMVVTAPQLAIYLGAPRPIPTAHNAAVSARPAHTQSVDWYGVMANELLDF
jgi:8-oxo-dGTP pyrophosphatase MutT (NUDIX family)